MSQKIIALLLLVLLTGSASGQEEGESGASPEEKPIQLTVSAVGAPSPVLRYRLLPELRERKAGNAALDYYRVFAEEMGPEARKIRDKAFEAWKNYRQMPPPELKQFANAPWLRQLDEGARRTHCDWDMLERLRKEGIAMLLPDVQGFRERISLLAARARFEMTEGRIDDAIRTFQTGFQMAQHISEGPTLIQFLVGAASANILIEQLEMLMEHPRGPNLYWALTSLPRPYLSIRTSLQGERHLLDSLLPGVRDMLYDIKSKPLSVQQVNELIDKKAKLNSSLDGPGGNNPVFNRIGLAMLAARAYPEAKKFLLSQGRSPQDVEAMPIVQAYLLYEVYNFDRIFDSFACWMHLPYLEAQGGMAEAERRLKQEKAAKGTPPVGDVLGLLLLPAVLKVKQAEYRIDRKIAFLRCIEALRLHAAVHKGRFPEQLADIKEVPVPLDPLTGQFFQYRLRGETAVLRAPRPAGWPPGAGSIWTYGITIRK